MPHNARCSPLFQRDESAVISSAPAEGAGDQRSCVGDMSSTQGQLLGLRHRGGGRGLRREGRVGCRATEHLPSRPAFGSIEVDVVPQHPHPPSATFVGEGYDDRMSVKARLSASVDAELLEAGQRAVDAGEAESVSAWVNDALTRQVAHDRRMRAMDELIAEYEAEHGVITDEEIAATTKRLRAKATPVRGRRTA